jgi:hypothetical protein
MQFGVLVLSLLTTHALFAASEVSQRPIMAEIPHDKSSFITEAPSGPVTLSDVLGKARQVNIFAGFIRDVASMSTRLEDASKNTTVLAPLNSVVQNLPRKPWEDPEQYDRFGTNAYEGNDGSQRAAENLRRFVEAHVVSRSPWREGEKVNTLAGRAIWWEEKNGRRMVSHCAVSKKNYNTDGL